MKEAIVFVNNVQAAILTDKDDVVKELNHFKAYWLSAIGSTYSNQDRTVIIEVCGLTHEDRVYFSSRMR